MNPDLMLPNRFAGTASIEGVFEGSRPRLRLGRWYEVPLSGRAVWGPGPWMLRVPRGHPARRGAEATVGATGDRGRALSAEARRWIERGHAESVITASAGRKAKAAPWVRPLVEKRCYGPYNALQEVSRSMSQHPTEAIPRPCPECAVQFIPTRPWQRFCNPKCRWRSWARDHPMRGRNLPQSVKADS